MAGDATIMVTEAQTGDINNRPMKMAIIIGPEAATKPDQITDKVEAGVKRPQGEHVFIVEITATSKTNAGFAKETLVDPQMHQTSTQTETKTNRA